MPKNESRQIRWILKFFGRIGGWRGVAFVIFTEIFFFTKKQRHFSSFLKFWETKKSSKLILNLV